MLPPATQDYLFEQFPAAFDLRATFDDGTTQTGTFDLNRVWQNSDIEPVYPLVTLHLSPTGVLREGEQPISDIVRESPSDDPAVAHERLYGQRVYDELTINMATKGYHEPTQTDPEERMSVLSTRIQQFVRFQLPRLLRGGSSDRNIIPVQVPSTGISDTTDTSGLEDNEHVIRRTFTVQLNYTLSFLDEIASVAGINVEFSTDAPGGTSYVGTTVRVEITYE